MKNIRSSFILALLSGCFTLTSVAQKPTLVRNQDEAGRTPYHQRVTFNQYPANCPNDSYCQANFSPVPAGFRLVITHASAHFTLKSGGSAAYITVGANSEVGGEQIYVPGTPVGFDQYIASSPVEFYVEPGDYPSIFINGQIIDRTSGYALEASIVGYLVAIP